MNVLLTSNELADISELRCPSKVRGVCTLTSQKELLRKSIDEAVSAVWWHSFEPVRKKPKVGDPLNQYHHFKEPD